jgi:hypothetical protein
MATVASPKLTQLKKARLNGDTGEGFRLKGKGERKKGPPRGLKLAGCVAVFHRTVFFLNSFARAWLAPYLAPSPTWPRPPLGSALKSFPRLIPLLFVTP